jgi:hypothetical protein
MLLVPNGGGEEGLREAPQNHCGFAGLVGFHESVDGYLSTLGADLQVIAIVGERLVAPLTPSDPWGLHLRDFFEQ